jgi:hyaluronan synthase
MDPNKTQVRWGRATHIETFQQPKVYLLNHPIFFWAAMKREVGPLIVLFSIIYYLITGKPFVYFCWWDLFFRAAYTILYNWLRNPDRGPTNGWAWIVPALLFYNVPLPAIQIWSMITVFNDGWGTTMRSNSEISKQSQSQLWKKWHDLGFFVVWMGVLGGTVARILGGLLAWGDGELYRAIWVGLLAPSAVTFYALILRT